jgi:hypothetical protein
VKAVIELVPQLLATGGHVIWTRGASDPDRRPEVRTWFRSAGLAEVSFDGAPETFGVGVSRLVSRPDTQRLLPPRLFRFAQPDHPQTPGGAVVARDRECFSTRRSRRPNR